MNTIFRVVRASDQQEIQRFIDLQSACVCWVKDHGKLRVEELEAGTSVAKRLVPPQECCQTLRTWVRNNKHFRPGERADMEQFIHHAC